MDNGNSTGTVTGTATSSTEGRATSRSNLGAFTHEQTLADPLGRGDTAALRLGCSLVWEQRQQDLRVGGCVEADFAFSTGCCRLQHGVERAAQQHVGGKAKRPPQASASIRITIAICAMLPGMKRQGKPNGEKQPLGCVSTSFPLPMRRSVSASVRHTGERSRVHRGRPRLRQQASPRRRLAWDSAHFFIASICAWRA